MNKIYNLIDLWPNESRYLQSNWFFKKIIFLWFLIDAIITLPYIHDIFSEDSLIYFQPFRGGVDWVSSLMNHADFSQAYPFFIVFQIAFLLIGLFSDKWSRATVLLTWFLSINLYSRAYTVLNGGNNLMILLLFYLIFVNSSGRPSNTLYRYKWLSEASDVFSVAGLFMCRIQVAIVYCTAAVLKITGKLWGSGMALYYIGQSDFAMPWFADFSFNNPLLMNVATYSTVAFQFSFPFLVWWKKTRWPVLLIGTSLHLGIIFSMGLFTFGLAMCFSYLAFLDKKRFDILKEWLVSFEKNIRALLTFMKEKYIKVCTSGINRKG